MCLLAGLAITPYELQVFLKDIQGQGRIFSIPQEHMLF
jgi:hypothetical protein